MDATSSIEPDPRRYGIVALYRELWRLALGHRGKILLAFGLLLGSQLFRLAVPWLTAQAIDAVQRSGLDGVGTAGRWLLAGFLATSASWLLHGPGRVLERNVALAARRRLSGELVGKLFSLPLAWHDRHHSGETVQRLRQCTGALYDFAQSQFIYLQNAARLVGPVIALCLIDLRVGVLALVGYLLIAVVIIGFDRRMILLAHRENAAERRHSATQLDAFGSIGTVNALRMGKGLARLIDERLVAIFEPLRRSIILNEWKWCSVDLLASGLAIGLVAAYAAILVASGGSGGGDADAVPGLPIGRLFMVYEYSAQAGGVITALGAHLQGFARQRADFAAGDVIRNASVEAGSGVAGAGRPADASGSQHWRELRIDGLRFAHPAGAELEVDGLRLVRGRRYALVGPSGSGKSTLLRILAGIYPAQRISLGIDASPAGTDPAAAAIWLRAAATLIPQESELFEGTVGDNLGLVSRVDSSHADLATMRDALDTSHAGQFLGENGTDARVAERGSNFSGGQRQRIALARGVVAAAGSGLLLLDEPSSALDAETEAAVHASLFAAFADCCIVCSVHRRELLVHFDAVLRMEHGRLVHQR
ncbi:MAG: ABC transporter ATP-binding protein/permease [Burkholderiaceae bacterium]|nr:ABC transporter ATP-binding protein/permease [Burkholderiaceae bacterium]MEB2318567.1 ABC transporter ATP-binding protein [Pseudomonadota bacterium]